MIYFDLVVLNLNNLLVGDILNKIYDITHYIIIARQVEKYDIP